MALKLVRERITLHRRDIAKLIEVAVEEDVPGDWGAIWRRFPRKASLATLEPIWLICRISMTKWLTCWKNM